MSYLPLLIHEFWLSAINTVLSLATSVIHFIKNTIIILADAQQRRVNYDVAYQLWRTEFRNESFDRVLDAVSKGSLEGLNK